MLLPPDELEELLPLFAATVGADVGEVDSVIDG
jgi:hypothetical protein